MGIINESIVKYTRSNNITIPYPHTTLTVDRKDKNLMQGINELIMKPLEKPVKKTVEKPIESSTQHTTI